MTFPIRKNTSMTADPRISTIAAFLKKKAEEDMPPEQNDTGLQNEIAVRIDNLVAEMKNRIYGFISELQRVVTKSKGSPAIDINELISLGALSNALTELDDMSIDYGSYLEQAGVDVESVEMALELLSEVEAQKMIVNSKSRRANLRLVNDQQVIDTLSSLMEVSIQDDDGDDEYPLDDVAQPKTPSIGADRGLIDMLVNSSEEEREKALKKYGLSKEKFNEILVENGYLTTKYIDKATDTQLQNAYKKFVEASVRYSSKEKVNLDNEAYDVKALVSAIKSSRLSGFDTVGKGKHSVILQDLSGDDFFMRYFFPPRFMREKNLSPAFSSLMVDLSYYAGRPNSVLRNVSNPYDQEDIDGLQSFFSTLKEPASKFQGQTGGTDKSKLSDFKQRLQELYETLPKTPPPFIPGIKKTISNLEAQIQEMEAQVVPSDPIPAKDTGQLVDNLQFGKKTNKEAKAIANMKDRANTTYNAYSRNPNDLGALGSALENYILLYNQSESKSPEQADKLNSAQTALMGSAWYRFVAPAYRFLQNANQFLYLIGVTRSGIDREAPRQQLQQMFSDVQKAYLEMVKPFSNNVQPQEAQAFRLKKMKDLRYFSSEFLSKANMYLSIESQKTEGFRAIADMFKNFNLIQINLKNPESVIVFKTNRQNKGQGQKTANSHISGFTIVPTYRIMRNG